MEAKIRPRTPSWRPKADPGGQLADPGGQGGELRGPKTSQDAKLEAERFPRRPTLEAKGGPGRQLGAKMERKGSPKGAKRVQKSSPRANIIEQSGNAKNLEQPNENQGFLRFQRVWPPFKTSPEAIKITVWRLRCPKSTPSRAQVGLKAAPTKSTPSLAKVGLKLVQSRHEVGPKLALGLPGPPKVGHPCRSIRGVQPRLGPVCRYKIDTAI